MKNIEFKGTPGKWYIKTAEKEEHKRLSIKKTESENIFYKSTCYQ